MSETLSVIDEHITDMKSPRSSYANGGRRDTFLKQPLVRQSYIAGAETDEEEQMLHTEAEVLSWGPERVAEYLEDSGVEKSHCDVFREQEISGEVLLAMDQNSLFIKEFDLGAIGRRLKTWHKIKALQDEVRMSVSPEPEREGSASEYSLGVETEDGADSGSGSRNRSSTLGASALPRGLSTGKRQSRDGPPTRSSTNDQYIPLPGSAKRGSFGVSPLQSLTSPRQESTFRPSAQGIRNLNHSRRHSSIDSNSTDGASRIGQRKQPSLDQKWEPGMQGKPNGSHGHAASTDSQFPHRPSSFMNPASAEDLDRGYFSSTEADPRTRKLTKRNSLVSPGHARGISFLDTTPESREPVSPLTVPTAHQSSAMHAVHTKFGTYRGNPPTSTGNMNPIVTKLDHAGSAQSFGATTASPVKLDDNTSDLSVDKHPGASVSRMHLGMFSSARAKVTGLRSISDTAAKDSKKSPTRIDQPVKSPTRTGSSTPSMENKSFDLSKSDMNSRTSTGSGNTWLPPPSVKRPRAKTKTKKATSAYTRGLEKKPPQEAMIDCSYSGWMKKKSGSLMTTWKTRLFILRGCRLSYYYSEDDTEEKGLIDISFHRVLAAGDEKVTGFHATVTGAAGGPTSPLQGTIPTLAGRDLREHPPLPGEDDGSLFIFKLVPPKAGLSKGVNFTKPTVHYFAVNSRREGRLWMAALMKATIDRDDSGVVTTTYNQKTISLAKARARMERPPELKVGVDDIGGAAELDAGGGAMSDTGLGIGGLDEKGSAVAGAEGDNEYSDQRDAASSIAPSTFAASTESDLNEQERNAVAMNA
jgi:hypothetical protein